MIESTYLWKNIFFLALGTLLIRSSIIGISGRIRISERVKEIFSYIPAAILPAFIAPAVFFHQGHVQWVFEKERFVVLLLATVVCVFTRNTLLTVIFGLGALYFMTHVIG